MQHGICEELYTDPSIDNNKGPLSIEPNNRVPDLSGKQRESPIKTFKLDNEEAILPSHTVNNSQQCLPAR